MRRDQAHTLEGITVLLLNSQPDTITLLSDWFGALGASVHHMKTLELCRRIDDSHTLILWRLQELIEWRVAARKSTPDSTRH